MSTIKLSTLAPLFLASSMLLNPAIAEEPSATDPIIFNRTLKSGQVYETVTVTPSGRYIQEATDTKSILIPHTFHPHTLKWAAHSGKALPEEEFEQYLTRNQQPSFRENSNKQARANGLTSDQIDTINNLQDFFNRVCVPSCAPVDSNERRNHENFDDPILVGKNVVFHKDWKKFIYGPKRTMEPEHFARMRDNLDQVYNSYVELTGGPPANGEKVLIRIADLKTGYAGHAHQDTNVFCIDSSTQENKEFLWPEIRNGSWSLTLMHEMAHVFSHSREWFIGDKGCENIAELMVSYAMEQNHGANYGTPNLPPVFPNAWRYKTSTEHRQYIFGNAFGQYQSGKIKPFIANSYTGDVNDFYLQGLVGVVGWEPYKKAFRSYGDPEFQSKYGYKGDDENVAAIDLLGRIAYFSPNRDTVLKSLPDGGQLLKKFNVKITPAKTLDTPPFNISAAVKHAREKGSNPFFSAQENNIISTAKTDIERHGVIKIILEARECNQKTLNKSENKINKSLER